MLVVGSMCSELCKPNNKFKQYNDYELYECKNTKRIEHLRQFVSEFDVALIYKLKSNKQNNKIILKSRRQLFLDSNAHMDFDFDKKTVIDQLKFLLNQFKNILSTKYGVEINQDAGTKDYKLIFEAKFSFN